MATRALHAGQLLLALTLLVAAVAASFLDMNCRYSAQRVANIDKSGAEMSGIGTFYASLDLIGRTPLHYRCA